jgi:CRP/FNR family transcriptional regulator, cyclic AMP receptor protein
MKEVAVSDRPDKQGLPGSNALHSPENEALIARFASSWQTVDLERGQVLFTEGDSADYLYLVKSGALRIISGSIVYEDLGPGGIVGEMGIVEQATPRSASVLALIPSTVIAIDEARFLTLVEKAPGFALSVMRVLSRRLRLMDERYRR